MNSRRERTLQDLCDATPTLSHPKITPVLRGNCKMQGPLDETNSNLLTHLLSPPVNKVFSSYSDRSSEVDYKGKSGVCNLCVAPCSSCFHVHKVLVKSSESAGETIAENAIIDQGERLHVGIQSEMSTVAGTNSTSDSFSENAEGKSSSRTSGASASDDNMTHSNLGGRKVVDGHDDCFSCVSWTDEGPNKKSDSDDGKIKDRQSKFTGNTLGEVPSRNPPAGLSSPLSKLVEVCPSNNKDDAIALQQPNKTCSEVFNRKSESHSPNLGEKNDDYPSDYKGELLEGSAEQLNSVHTTELGSDIVSGDPPFADLNVVEKNNDLEVENHSSDETDDSDMVEHDVKVCDICGDAGREDLLAICCQCSDGAEHTYCMRQMLNKVPEGDWLCEECNSLELVKNERPEKVGRVDEHEKNIPLAQTSTEFLNNSDVEGQRAKTYLKPPGKRLREDADTEVSSGMKKPALEFSVGSAKISNSSRTADFSHEVSLKDLDKGRKQSLYLSASDMNPVHDTVESARATSDMREKSFRGTYARSNSFNSLVSKPKVKLVDQAVLQRQKSARDHASFHAKEGSARSVGKTMSFKITNSGRSESNFKTLSPRAPQVQDIKNTKQRSSFERQSSFKAEHPSICSMPGTSKASMQRIDKKLAARGESSSRTNITNHNDIKGVKGDGKSTLLSRSSSITARQNAGFPSLSGAFKRPSLHNPSTLVVSSVNGVNNSEPKSNQTSPKENSSSCSVAAEHPPFNANEGLPDGLFRPREFENPGERVREFSGNRFCPSSMKSSRDESSNLKTAIEAAVLRKPGGYRKQRTLGPSVDSSIANSGCELVSHLGNIPSYSGKRNMSSESEPSAIHTASQDLTVESNKQEIMNGVKLLADGQSPIGNVADLAVDEKTSSKYVFSSVAAAIPFFLKSFAIPEHEFIWQGSFEIYRSVKRVDFWDGVQAHLSTCASSKVTEAVNKFKSRIILHEVPRLSIWPVQFQEHGVREDNIALFFFAKDLESYNKIYKVMLDNMMKNDLALRGNVNGVELLIFPSNYLPDNSQRWNMLFFLWGVFRGKKESCLQHMPESQKQDWCPRDIPSAIISLPENRCALPSIGIDFATRDGTKPASKMPIPEELSLSKARNVDSGRDVSSMDQLDCGQNADSSAITGIDSEKQYEDTTDACLEGATSSSSGLPQGINSPSISGREHMPVHLDHQHDGKLPCHRKKAIVGSRDMILHEVFAKETILDKSTCNQNQMNCRMGDRDPSPPVGEIHGRNNRDEDDLNREQKRWLLKNKEPLHPESCVAPETLYSSMDQGLRESDDMHGKPCRAPEKMDHITTGSYVLGDQHREAFDETLVQDHNENAERHFFPLESPCTQKTWIVDGDISWKMLQLEKDHLQDKTPNLELALGAESKPLTGIRPLVVSAGGKKIDACEPSEGRTKVVDDVSASLSLSLSFPFPEKEQSTQPASRDENLVSRREHITNPMLLFGGLRDS